jgi:hypothetical protein
MERYCPVWFRQMVMGNLMEQTFNEIWNSKKTAGELDLPLQPGKTTSPFLSFES